MEKVTQVMRYAQYSMEYKTKNKHLKFILTAKCECIKNELPYYFVFGI